MLLKDFYSVVSSTELAGEFITEVKINKDHDLYRGHFPDRPVTPGVILMQLFKEEAERRSNKKLQLATAANVKFMAVVDPNICEKLILQSSIVSENGILKLKGIAKQNDTISLKISATYKPIS
ncbi:MULTISPECIES: hydroxymyristoyl-ACP dehydratase [Gillisia]|jgi:3-hydroxyacyl-[acyl-carrier-protein] dehydratase|uniref:Hydroxymyristoyl-ACP dehydratase n=1 Tax=Gillisia hiemivivida TaxID=291190 RepID=A0A5C6ZTN8_9FLAO|nr:MULTISPECIES: hydroxymyristoyl-ACP dehydratase [Gillisia]TXD94177.1 hydroxymyristoyl-ACP dehydratase [Gillisia hiemivivida]